MVNQNTEQGAATDRFLLWNKREIGLISYSVVYPQTGEGLSQFINIFIHIQG